MPTCPTCQATLLENARFCAACDTRISDASQAVPDVAASSAAPMPPQPLRLGIFAVPPTGPSNQVAAPAQGVAKAARISSRTIAIAGLLLCLLFFSPFVSCGARTWTGAQAFQDSLPSQYQQPKDGIVLILLPIAGLAVIVVGLIAMNRVASGSSPSMLRALGAAALLITFMAACPLGVVLIDVNRSDGAFTLEWGFWASVLAMFAMGWSAAGLLRMRKEAGYTNLK